jgi:hypothetical protein
VSPRGGACLGGAASGPGWVAGRGGAGPAGPQAGLEAARSSSCGGGGAPAARGAQTPQKRKRAATRPGARWARGPAACSSAVASPPTTRRSGWTRAPAT